MWGREPRDDSGQRAGVTESTRCSAGYSRVAALAATLPETRLVCVADRETDIAALMALARDLGHPADWRDPLTAQPGITGWWQSVVGSDRGRSPGRHLLYDALAPGPEGA